MDHAVGFGYLFSGIAEDGVVNAEGFGKSLVFFGGVSAGSEVSYFGVLERLAILTE